MPNTLTDKELQVMKTFISESLDCCGSFSEEENMSYCNDKDLSKVTGMSRHQVAGLMGQLEKKGLIIDWGDSARGEKCNDYIADYTVCEDYPQLMEFIANY